MFRKLLAASVLSIMAAGAMAAECEVVLEGNDQMKYNLDKIEMSKSCETFTIHLKHVGKMAKNVMGHNVVISKAEDLQAIATDGIMAGVDADYLKADDERVIANTHMIGGGEETSLELKPADFDPANKYKFFCTFPGHVALMQGDLIVTE